jgi:radical SAM superfamily enzyme YgiQ (UPF0313 family)
MKKLRNILMVYPEVPNNTYWSFKYALRFIHKKSGHPPLGLVTIAALFPEICQLRLVDMNIEPLIDADIAWADAVFISAMIVQHASVDQVVAACRRQGKPTILGGPYANSNWREIKGVDHFVLGEVEDTFQSFFAELENGTAPQVYRCPSKPDISNTVAPRFDLLKLDAYASMSIQYSRGCPFTCEFCDIWKVYGNRPRVKSPGTVLSELDALFHLGWRGAVFIVDDNFIGNKTRVKNDLLPALKTWQERRNFVFRFFTEASINLAEDSGLLSAMRDVGFNEVFIGIETPSVECLKETGKFQNLKTDLKASVKTIQQHGMEVMAGFILGFDNDSEDIFERQIAFIQQTGIPKAMVGIMIALPGTDLYQRLTKEGRIVSVSAGNNTHCLEPNFKPRMDLQKLKEGYQKVLAAIYDKELKNYFARCSLFLKNLGRSPHFEREIGLKEIIMLFKSLGIQTFKPYGLQYLKFVGYHFVKNPHLFGEVIKYCIIGHHFYTITQETLKIEKISSHLDDCWCYLRDQVNQYSVSVKENSREAICLAENLWHRRKQILDTCKAGIDKIHVDFQPEIRLKYNEMAEKMKELLIALEADMPGYGIRSELKR